MFSQESNPRSILPGLLTCFRGPSQSASYGAPRSTQDIDFVIAATPSELRGLIQGLPSDQYYVDLDAALEAHKTAVPIQRD